MARFWYSRPIDSGTGEQLGAAFRKRHADDNAAPSREGE